MLSKAAVAAGLVAVFAAITWMRMSMDVFLTSEGADRRYPDEVRRVRRMRSFARVLTLSALAVAVVLAGAALLAGRT